MNLLMLFLSILFLFLMTFGGTILGKIAADYRALKKEELKSMVK